jgi:hypothetical protein
MSPDRTSHSHAKSTAALLGCGALFWMAFWAAPYLYALDNLIQWR